MVAEVRVCAKWKLSNAAHTPRSKRTGIANIRVMSVGWNYPHGSKALAKLRAALHRFCVRAEESSVLIRAQPQWLKSAHGQARPSKVLPRYMPTCSTIGAVSHVAIGLASTDQQLLIQITFMPRPALRGGVRYLSGIALTACINASQSSGGLPVSSILANTA